MKSMTGYGVSQWKTDNYSVEVIVQTYNGRHLELRVQAPPFYTSLEGEWRKELSSRFNRGSVQLLINRYPLWPLKKTTLRWNKREALKWKTLYGEMAKALRMKGEPGLLDLAQQPGVLEVVSQPSLVSLQEQRKLKALIRQAIALCNKERAREGVVLKQDFQKHLKSLSVCLRKVKSHAGQQARKIKQNVKDKMESFDAINEKNTIHEITGSLINKMDISEELNRMGEHIKVFGSLISARGVKGKKMSFYLQEMIREMNTVGSKSQSAQLTKEVVQAKSTIEKMREQVQNVE